MKNIILATIMVLLSSSQLLPINCYQAVSSRISNWGSSIEKVENVPVIGKLTNLLPIAALAGSLRNCPIQTMILLGALTMYYLSYSEHIQEMMKRYGIVTTSEHKNHSTEENIYIDEDIFTFDKNEEENEVVDNNIYKANFNNHRSEKNIEPLENVREHPTFL